MQIGSGGGGVMTVSTGGLLRFGGTFNPVGNQTNSQGTLLVLNGGTAQATAAPGSTLLMQIGNQAAVGTLGAADGTVVVSGSGSLLDLNGNGLGIGNNGIGSLAVTAGGTVNASVLNTGSSAALFAASGTGSVGGITVAGTGTAGNKAVLNIGGYAGLAQAGSASLTVGSGGLVNITNAATGSAGLGIGVGSSTNATNIGGQAVAGVTNGGTINDQGSIAVGGNGVSGVLNVSGGGAAVSVGTRLMVGIATNIGGTVYGGTGSVNIAAGGTVRITEAPQISNYAVQIGVGNSSIANGLAPTAAGVVTVSGTGALLDTNTNALVVGAHAPGVLTISQGATALVGSADSNTLAALGIGQFAPGQMVVTDPGSKLISAGVAYIGRASSGDLLISNSGSVVVNNDVTGQGVVKIGGANGFRGTLDNTGIFSTGGAGSVQVTSSGDLSSQSGIEVGLGGVNGALFVNTGGTVNAGSTLSIGNTVAVASGMTVITTTGTTITNGTSIFASHGEATVGAGGLLKANGAGIATAGTSDIEVGADQNSSGVLNVSGTGATVNTSGYQMAVGEAGQGTMLVSAGGTVLAGTKFASDGAITIGTSAGATGAITVTDPKSSITAAGQINVGASGIGSLLIENQATVISGNSTLDPTQGIDLGQLAGGSGILTVTGANSKLSNTGEFIVGDGGRGSLVIASGATVATNPGTTAGLAGLVIGNSAGTAASRRRRLRKRLATQRHWPAGRGREWFGGDCHQRRGDSHRGIVGCRQRRGGHRPDQRYRRRQQASDHQRGDPRRRWHRRDVGVERRHVHRVRPHHRRQGQQLRRAGGVRRRQRGEF